MNNKPQIFWDQQAGRYDESEKSFEPLFTPVLSWVKEYMKPDDNVLDFGCATGTKTLSLAGGVKHIHGLDFSGAMIGEAIRKRDEAGITNASFFQGTIFSNDLEESSFDAVLAFAVLHLLEECEQTVGRIHELLKPGGRFISLTTCFREKMTFSRRMEVLISVMLKRAGLSALSISRFDSSELRQMLVRQHFNIIRSETLFHDMTISFIVAEKYQ